MCTYGTTQFFSSLDNPTSGHSLDVEKFDMISNSRKTYGLVAMKGIGRGGVHSGTEGKQGDKRENAADEKRSFSSTAGKSKLLVSFCPM